MGDSPSGPLTVRSRKSPAATQGDPQIPSSFDGPRLWIHHDAKHMKAGPHRHRVFAHVQRHYRPWKRHQSTKSLRTSAKVPKPRDKEEAIPSPRSIVAKGNSDPFGVLA